ncbi:MAG: conjugative transfer ATPase, partial [Candidatus Competibacteraceae bacterium]|nr:conjugative transfer ATPase [Candidatus Competibacteraceae bacterium]
WWFDEQPHEVVTVQDLRGRPRVGHFTAEQRQGDHIFALFDRVPEGTVMVMTLIVRPQDVIQLQLDRIRATSHGENAEAEAAHDQAVEASRAIEQGNKLYPVVLAFYLRGQDRRDLEHKRTRINALLVNNNLQPIAREADLLLLDSYIRHLPMAYDAQVDRVSRRSRLMFSSDIAALLPVYGRSVGTGNPGLLFFNRGAEPLTFDPLNRQDRKKNAHLLLLGPTGAGKSAMLVYLILQMVAHYRPRIFIIEAGNSFGLLCQYLAGHGLSTHEVTVAPGQRVSLLPFGDAQKLLRRPVRLSDEDLGLGVEEDGDGSVDGTEDREGAGEERRDILGEMEIAARLMVTGGDPREEERLRRHDRLALRKGILRGAEISREAGREQTLTRDVVAGLRALAGEADLAPGRAGRILEMADALELFTTGFEGELFDRPGAHWPEVDITRLELGYLAREGYEDKLAVAYVGAMNHINDLVERCQHEARPTLVITDEGHVITTNPLLAPYLVKVVKMWRKYGAWLWLATQNMEDLPDAARRLLNLMEFWLCLVMPRDEVEQISRFKSLNDEQRSLLTSAMKEPGKFV